MSVFNIYTHYHIHIFTHTSYKRYLDTYDVCIQNLHTLSHSHTHTHTHYIDDLQRMRYRRLHGSYHRGQQVHLGCPCYHGISFLASSLPSFPSSYTENSDFWLLGPFLSSSLPSVRLSFLPSFDTYTSVTQAAMVLLPSFLPTYYWYFFLHSFLPSYFSSFLSS